MNLFVGYTIDRSIPRPYRADLSVRIELSSTSLVGGDYPTEGLVAI